ncbi:MBL fold metallo-hydrolase [Candidatus Nomurabacteria bacterium]|nr:MBL fold metallo-hydrolase [Candidatus Nomurabacteria bacterium]
MLTKRFLYIVFLTVLLLFSAVFLFKNIHFVKEKELLSVYFLDVGQGDAILIESPNGNQVLVDAGLDGKVVEEVGKKLSWFDKNIDAILMTHPDADHIGGFPAVLSSYSTDYLFESEKHEDTDIVFEIEKRSSQQNAKLINVKRGDKIFLDIDRDIYLDILFPDDDFVTNEKNETSIVAKLIYGKTSFLLTGDSPKNVEQYLISIFGNYLESDVLKVGHHGSNTSTSDLFLGFVKAKYGIISAGKNNSFGHPHQEVLDSLKKFNVEIFETKNLATIVARSNGREVWFEN